MLSIQRRTTRVACPLCRDPLDTAEEQTCPACDTSFHTACFDELGGCTTLGCAKRGRRPVRAFTRVQRPEPAHAPQAESFTVGWLHVWCVIEVIGVIGMIAAGLLG